MVMVYLEKWWISLLRGVFAFVLGMIMLFRPVETLSTLFILFALFLILDGLITGGIALFHHRSTRRWLMSFQAGLLGVILGALILLWPEAVILIFIIIIALWALIFGVMSITAGFRMRSEVIGSGMMISIGIVAAVFGFILLLMPRASLITMTWILALFLIVFGLMQIIMSFLLRKYQHHSNHNRIMSSY